MRRLALAAVSVLVACAPDIPTTPPPTVITARFDPAAVPAVVPTPNDLATDPATGLLAVPVPMNAGPADTEFITDYLNGLDGFPTGASAACTFDGELAASSVTAQTVRVYDVTNNHAVVTAAPAYAKTSDTSAPGLVSVTPPAGGWAPGHTYAVVVIGGASGVQGGNGTQVVGSATWAFIRNKNSLLKCEGTVCETATELIPSDIKDDAAKRLEDQTAKATLLERLRLHYKDTLDVVEASGVARTDIALAWTFRTVGQPRLVFDPAGSPPQVPTPNDLAIDRTTGKVKAPVDPTSSAAQQEFTTDYLNTLNGFPVSAVAEAKISGGALDPATVNDMTVLVAQLSGSELTGDPVISYDATANSIKIAPPGGTWGKTRKFAVAVLNGKNGVQRAGGGLVAPSDAWALVRSKATLVTCSDLTSASCAPAIAAAPLSTAQAVGLEGLRRAYAPVLDLLGVERKTVALLWVFSTVDQPEATFDPGNSVVPFPTDLLRNPTTGKLNIPVPPGASATQAALIGGLNTLDGFSLTAPAVTENGDTRAVLDEGKLNASTLADGGTGFIKVAGAGPLSPQVQPCLNCLSSKLADGGVPASPEQLQFVPVTPLEEQSTYAPYLTTALRDASGREVSASPVFALVRLKNPLIEGGKSTVSVVSDAQAALLEPVRQSLKPALDALDAQGIKRAQVALAWSYTTQSTVSVIKQVYTTVSSLPSQLLDSTPTYVLDVTTTVRAQMTGLGIPNAAVGKIYQGNVTLPFILTGPGGTLNPNLTMAKRYKAPFLVTVPASTPPTGGFPVLIFGHGLTGNRTNMLALANSAASAGYLTIAIDAVYHGERTSCVGSASVLQTQIPNATDDYACADPVTQKCDADTGRCISRDRTAATACTSDLQCVATAAGYCAADGKCEAADFRRASAGAAPLIAAWNFLNLTNFFATRDNFRYAVIDFAQLIRVLKDATSNGLHAKLAALDANSVYNPAVLDYAGQSLGTFHGNMLASVSPDIRHVALNVPGSDQVQVLLTAPGFSSVRVPFLAGLGQLGLTPGTPGFDNFLVLAKTIIDPADPQNMTYSAVNLATASDRKVYMQYIQGDEVLPNRTTEQLIAAAKRGAKQPQVFEFVSPTDFDGTVCPGSERHGFMLRPMTNCPQASVAAQTKLVTFLATGTAP
ncbi:MAG: hypothetical protein K1X89_08860 [Myxococcaceae bacterium]|nr:hypothetical protein [Myxococcaceae bacterium]